MNATRTRRTKAHIANPCSVLTSAAWLPAAAGDVCCNSGTKESYAKMKYDRTDHSIRRPDLMISAEAHRIGSNSASCMAGTSAANESVCERRPWRRRERKRAEGVTATISKWGRQRRK